MYPNGGILTEKNVKKGHFSHPYLIAMPMRLYLLRNHYETNAFNLAL